MDDERLRVLKLVESGTITPEQGARLLDALERAAGRQAPGQRRGFGRGWRMARGPLNVRFGPGGGAEAGGQELGPPSGARWLRLRVTDRQGRNKVNVQLPLSVVATALRLGGRWVPDLARFNPDIVLAAMQLRTGGRLFEAIDEEGGDRVELLVE